MDRIYDKLVIAVCCLPALAVVQTDTALVAALLVAIGVSATDEALQQSASTHTSSTLPLLIAAAVLSSAYLVAACFLPVASPFMALAVYDLVYTRKVSALALIALVALGMTAQMGAPAVELALIASTLVLSAVLAARTGHLQAQRLENRHERDDLRERSLSLEKKNRDLLDRQEYEARLATLNERGRIAREIHDNVGHLLTRAIMQVEALRVVHAQEPQVNEEFGAVAGTLHEALDTMRESVHGMADDACDLSVQVRQVVEDVCRDTNLTASCDIEAATASPQVTACFTAIVREALSNTLRHADGATHVRIELVEHPGLWRLTVTDNGRRPAAQPDGTGGGMGLASMEQRVRNLGGTMSAEYSERAHGFVVFASIPRKDRAA
ncbi:MAG: sensor histidine kinase [Coriobacteriales bacterium]|jgi:signal transduction histidine kinase